MGGKIVDVTDKNFDDEVVRSNVPVLVDFWAPWCGPCRSLTPVLEKLSLSYDGRVKICKVNVDENSVTASKFSIRSIPTMILFSKGKSVDQLQGNVPEGVIVEFLKKASN